MGIRTDDIDVFIGIDVGKSDHWATAVTREGKKLFDKALPNSEDRLRDLYDRLGEHGRLLVVIDQPATIGTLAVAAAQDMGLAVAYLPGLSMRRIADLTPGNAKTDAKDAAGVVLPHLARQLAALHAQRHDIAAQVEALASGPPSIARP